MTKRYQTLTLMLLSLLCLSFKAEDPLEKILKKIAKYASEYPQEKVHIHTDKPYYATGEEIWFKTYLVSAYKNEPSIFSSVLYVELIDSKNKIKKKQTIFANQGLANGSIRLTDTLSSGSYRLRAYTSYMRNFSPEFFFEKNISIVNINDKKLTEAPKQDNQNFDIKFFPEGGNLIEGFRNKIGVKALRADGLGLNLSGQVINQNGDLVVSFTTEHVGMGAFALIPKPGEKYTAVVTLSNGNKKHFDLPVAQTSGRTLSVHTIADKVNVRVASTADLTTAKELYIIAQNNGIVYAHFKVNANEPVISTSVSTKMFPTGLVQFTLFDENANPIAERVAFINHQDALKVNLETTNAVSTTKKKTELSISIMDIQNNPVVGNFSIAVTDAAKIIPLEDSECTILSNLLLTSDLKGYIENPNYYFNAPNEDKSRQLDYLLLTQGWRRFIWKDILNDQFPPITHNIQRNISINGTALNASNNKPVANAKLLLLSTNKNFILLLDTLTNADGRFEFNNLSIPDSVSLILQAKTAKNGENIKIIVDQPPFVTPYLVKGKSVDLAAYVAETQKHYADLKKFNPSATILLDEVAIKERKSAIPVNEVMGSKSMSAQADYVITKQKLVDQSNLFQAFYTMPGVRIVNNNVVRASTRTVSITSAVPQPMMVLLDGVIVSQDIIKDIPPKSVEAIELLTSNYNTSVYGPNGYWGVIIITTKTLDEGERVMAINKLKLSNIGFAFTKEFYVPNYDDPSLNPNMNDFRSTIYWNPNVNSDISGKALLSYFNAGTPSVYNVVIEGIDANGNLARKVYTYEVK